MKNAPFVVGIPINHERGKLTFAAVEVSLRLLITQSILSSSRRNFFHVSLAEDESLVSLAVFPSGRVLREKEPLASRCLHILTGLRGDKNSLTEHLFLLNARFCRPEYLAQF